MNNNKKIILVLLTLITVQLAGCRRATIYRPQTYFPQGECPKGVGGKDRNCCDMNGNLLTTPPPTCTTDTPGEAAVEASLVSGFTAIQIANDEINEADLMVGLAGIDADLTVGSTNIPSGTPSGTPNSGNGSGNNGAGQAPGSSGSAPQFSGNGSAPSGGVLDRVSDFAKNLFGAGSSPAVSNLGVGSGSGSGSSSGSGSGGLGSNGVTGAGAGGGGGSSPASSAGGGGLAGGGSSGTPQTYAAVDKSILDKMQNPDGGVAGSEYTGGGGSGRGGGGNSSGGGFGGFGDGAVSAAGGNQVMNIGAANRGLASDLNPMLGEDPEDYFSRIAKDESLFYRVHRTMIRKETDLTLVRYQTEVYPNIQTLKAAGLSPNVKSALPLNSSRRPASVIPQYRYQRGGASSKKTAR